MNINIYKQYLSNIKMLFIDEAQKFSNIGSILKILADNFKELKILVTGSSSFELANQVGEPLVGRKWQYNLYPISLNELKSSGKSSGEIKELLNMQLVYGMFPEVIGLDDINDKQKALFEIIEGQLYRDILKYKNLRNSEKLVQLLKLLAWQIGKEVSISELSRNLELSVETVFNYLDLLEKVFLIKRVGGYSSNNLRKEIVKSNRYYFLDNGFRNAVINNFSDIKDRNGDDVGQLFENFIFMERVKYLEYSKIKKQQYFWRTYDSQEVDLVEIANGKIDGYEFKFNEKIAKIPVAWRKTYKSATFETINKNNYFEWLTV
jgi:predicted AAA+ superfamily ATPase